MLKWHQLFSDNVFGDLKNNMIFIYVNKRYNTIFHREESSHKNRKNYR